MRYLHRGKMLLCALFFYCAGSSATEMASGGTYSGNVEPYTVTNFYFNVEAGDGAHIIVKPLTLSNSALYLFQPDGSSAGSSGNGALHMPNLAYSGTWRVAVRGYYAWSSGTFEIQFLRGGGTVSEGLILKDGARSGILNNYQMATYTINADAGDDATISVSGASGNPRIYIYKPDGSYWGSNFTLNINDFPQSGKYTLMVRPNFPSNTVGNYTVTYDHIDNTPTPASTPDTEKHASAQEDCPSASGGNPINFAMGFKHQKEQDWKAGMLELKRFYHSDGNFITGDFGANWRHGYHRELSFPAADEAEIIDNRGAVVKFEKPASDWILVDSDYQAELTEIVESMVVVGYVYKDESDTKEYYDTSGSLTRIEYRAREALDFEYDGSNRLEYITDQHGKFLAFSYDGSDRVQYVTTPDGVFTYSYDGNNNLATVTNPDSDARTYHYENGTYVNALTGITDERGIRYSTYGYNGSGLANYSKHNGDVDEFSVTYNMDDTVTTTNALGKDTTYTFETIQGVRKIVEIEGEASASCAAGYQYFTYNDDGRLETATDWEGNVSVYAYDERGSIDSITQGYGMTEERTTSFSYNAEFRLPEAIIEEGKITSFSYDAHGRVEEKTILDTAASVSRTWGYSYHSNTVDGNGNTVLGQLDEVDGPRSDVSDVTSYDYDAYHRLYKITNAAGHEIEITSFDSADRPLTIDDANNITTTLTYDNFGRVETSTSNSATTTYGYDEVGNLTSVELPNGAELTYTYNNARRLTGITDDMGNTITYAHDDAGNITQADYKDANPTLRYTISYAYDELSRILSLTDANADVTSFEHDLNDNLLSVTDGEMNETEYAYDGLNRLVESTNALMGVSEFAYNALDQMEDVTDPRSNVTSYTYNAFGEITQQDSPDTGVTTFTYDEAGNLAGMEDARSVVTNYTYDALNRLTAIEYPSDSSLDVSLTYDSPSGCGYSKGRLCEREDAGGTVNYIYDALGRLTDVTETRGALSFTTEYGYDAASVLNAITLPSGREISYTLNANGQVSAVSVDASTVASSITYMPFGPLASMTYGNSIALTNSYNTAYQLTSKQHGGLFYESYSYDDAGNILTRGGTTYVYDDLYRVTGDDSDSYTYDALGNRTGGPSGSFTYSGTSNILTAIGASPITTDAAGNITEDASREYVIDAANRLESIDISSSTVGTYTYDANALRTKKVTGAGTVHYVYGMNGLLYGEYDASGNMIREYVYLNGQPIAQYDAGTPDVITYLHTDHLGTPRAGSNSGGSGVWAWSSDAFGNGSPTGSATVNLRFPGQYYDSESGLHYNWNRYYDPATGRYVSSDPIGLEGGLNTFAYVNANPVMFYDPDGLEAIPWSTGARRIPIIGTVLDICMPTNQTCETHPEAFGPECGPMVSPRGVDTGNNDFPEDDAERCKKVLEQCREICHLDGGLTESGDNSLGDYRQCMRTCMNDQNCSF